jgi:hypothetical protein
MISHRGELFVFGGVYPEPDPTPDTCSNTLHIFNFAEKNWYRPIVSGGLPAPRSGHSATWVHHSHTRAAVGNQSKPFTILEPPHIPATAGCPARYCPYYMLVFAFGCRCLLPI